MRRYYLFQVKGTIFSKMKNDSKKIYEILEKIKNNKFEIRENYYLFNKYFDIHKTKYLHSNLKNIKGINKNKNKYLLKDEGVLLEINHSVLVMVTYENIPKILREMHKYSKYLFVVDFQNKDYFWLDDYYNRLLFN